jgi:hypothetical protein
MTVSANMQRKLKLAKAGNYLHKAHDDVMQLAERISNMQEVIDAGGWRDSDAEAIVSLANSVASNMKHAQISMLFSPDRVHE